MKLELIIQGNQILLFLKIIPWMAIFLFIKNQANETKTKQKQLPQILWISIFITHVQKLQLNINLSDILLCLLNNYRNTLCIVLANVIEHLSQQLHLRCWSH